MIRTGYLWLFLWIFGCSAQTHYYSCDTYGGLIYNILQEFTTTHTQASTFEIKQYLHGDSTKTVFNDAFYMGYSKRLVIKTTYELSIQNDPINQMIIDALQDDLRWYHMWKDVYYWGVLSAASLSTLFSLFGIGFYIRYVKRDKRAIEHYIASSYLLPATSDD